MLSTLEKLHRKYELSPDSFDRRGSDMTEAD
jgi:hypothetical protein